MTGAHPPGGADDPERRTRPTGRLVLLVLLALLVYGAGANIGSGGVLFLAAGMLVGVLWSVLPFLLRVGRVRLVVDPVVHGTEGVLWLAVTASIPPGVMGVVGLEADRPLPREDQWSLLAVLGVDHQRCSDCPAPAHWAALPPGGGSATLEVPAVRARGVDQPQRVIAELTDPLGLVRRRLALRGPVLQVLPGAGSPAPFRATTEEEDADEERQAHALAASGAPDAELRRWRAGESIRSVHWPASLRADRLLVRPRAPETSQRRRLGIEDRDWTRTELDARCRDVVATADRLTAAGVEVELVAAGHTLSWGRGARRLLAGLPPHAGATGSGAERQEEVQPWG